MSQCRCLLMVIRGGKERSRGHLLVTEEAGEGSMGTGETAGTAREPGEPPPLNTEEGWMQSAPGFQPEKQSEVWVFFLNTVRT